MILQAAQQTLLDPMVWCVVIGSAIYGIFIGAMPGLSATMGVALFVPLTFWLDPLPALAGIVTMVACAIFAGDIPTTLVRMPGTPASAAYADDAYALSRRGEARTTLGVMLWFSVTGGLFGAVVLMLLGNQLAKMAGWFSVSEYFWLYLMGLSCAVIVGGSSIPRSLLGLLIGMMFSTVGLSAVHSQARFTFGQPELFQGINFIPAMIGLFGLSEVLRGAAGRLNGGEPQPTEASGAILPPAIQLFSRRFRAWLRSSTIGALVGILPGAGADIASWVSGAVSKRRSKQPENYGNGSTECIADACAANSASLAGAWIPALVFGIPGDSVTAIVIGVLYMKNLKPGPEIFEAQGVLVFSLYIVFILANLVMLPIGLLAIRAGGWVMRIPRSVLLPIILLLCIVGSFAASGSLFDVALMAAFGLIGLVCERYKISIGAMVLGMILGGPLEERFVQTLAGSGGSPLALVNRPVAALLAIICFGVWLSVAVSSFRKSRLSATSIGLPIERS
ncbi:MAG TPA: C4-dicarboxylate ABC transporter permease [Planctomycetaceae bacterium]|nr:C4-dicarboxylate ABC transporter permease [Planctomycetaceae bacterium]